MRTGCGRTPWTMRHGMEVQAADKIPITDAPIGAVLIVTSATGLTFSQHTNCRLDQGNAGRIQTMASTGMWLEGGNSMRLLCCKAACHLLCLLLRPRTTAPRLAPMLWRAFRRI